MIKKIEMILSVLLFVLTNISQAQEATLNQAHYYRFWQGFRKANLSQDQFKSELPSFIKDTVDLYDGKGLNNYLVFLPANPNKPSFIADELALVAFDSEDSYLNVRKTPQGQLYSDRHWDVFEKGPSKSAPLIHGLPLDKIEFQTAYDVINEKVDWNTGYSTLYIGLRKNNISTNDFIVFMKDHISEVANIFKPHGLKGYLALVGQDYEIAFQNWSSKEDAQNALNSNVEFINNTNQYLEVYAYESAVQIEKNFSAISEGTLIDTQKLKKE